MKFKTPEPEKMAKRYPKDDSRELPPVRPVADKDKSDEELAGTPPFPNGKLPEADAALMKSLEEKKSGKIMTAVGQTLTSDEQSELERIYRDKRALDAWHVRLETLRKGEGKPLDPQDKWKANPRTLGQSSAAPK